MRHHKSVVVELHELTNGDFDMEQDIYIVAEYLPIKYLLIAKGKAVIYRGLAATTLQH